MLISQDTRLFRRLEIVIQNDIEAHNSPNSSNKSSSSANDIQMSLSINDFNSIFIIT